MRIIDNVSDKTVAAMGYGVPFSMQDPERDAGEAMIAVKILAKDGRSLIVDVKTGREIENADMTGVAKPYKDAAIVLDGNDGANDVPKPGHNDDSSSRDAVYYGPGEKAYIENAFFVPHERTLGDVPMGGICKIDLKAQEIYGTGLGDAILAVRADRADNRDEGRAEVIDLCTGKYLSLSGKTSVTYLPGAAHPIYRSF